jgi:hypothetical protein
MSAACAVWTSEQQESLVIRWRVRCVCAMKHLCACTHAEGNALVCTPAHPGPHTHRGTHRSCQCAPIYAPTDPSTHSQTLARILPMRHHPRTHRQPVSYSLTHPLARLSSAQSDGGQRRLTLSSTCLVFVFIRICSFMCSTIGLKIFSHAARSGARRCAGTGTRRLCTLPPWTSRRAGEVRRGEVQVVVSF